MTSLNQQGLSQAALSDGGRRSVGRSAAAGATEVLSRVRKTVSALSANGLAATYWHYHGLTHGPMFNASFQSALLHLAAAGERSERVRHTRLTPRGIHSGALSGSGRRSAISAAPPKVVCTNGRFLCRWQERLLC